MTPGNDIKLKFPLIVPPRVTGSTFRLDILLDNKITSPGWLLVPAITLGSKYSLLYRVTVAAQHHAPASLYHLIGMSKILYYSIYSSTWIHCFSKIIDMNAASNC